LGALYPATGDITVLPKVSGSFIGRMPPAPSGEYTVARRDHLSAGTSKLVSFMPSGVKTRSRKNASSDCPDTTSTTRPNTSVDKL
jgi:hypothetical protein